MAKSRGWSSPPSSFKLEIDDAVSTRQRVIAMAMMQEIVYKSPVGNPSIWKANLERKASNIAAADAYDALAATLGNKKLTKKERDQNYYVNDLAAGRGYVGGTFRGNNFVTIDEPGYYQLNRVDANGSATVAAASAAIRSAAPYSVIYLQNNLPYAEKLELGHSTQAPAGIYAVAFHGVSQAYSS